MKTVCVIPARYGSTRLAGKMLADIAGTPLIVHTCQRVAEASRVQQILVATDDERIAETVGAHGIAAVLTDPQLPSGTDRVWAAVKELVCDLVINVQGDEPLMNPAHIDALPPLFEEPTPPDMATLSAPYPTNIALEDPSAVKVVTDNNGWALYFSRAPIPYPRNTTSPYPPRLHLGIYAYKPEFLRRFVSWPVGALEQTECLEQLRALEHGARIRVAEVGHATPGVDTLEDLERVRKVFARTIV